MAALIRRHAWEDSPLGPMAGWPVCLTSAVELMLPAAAQIVMFWGEDFVALYNDAYAPTIGDKHPRALGRPARENWSELWSDLEPLLRHVLDRGETVVAKDRPFHIERHGYPETVHFDISYSPVRDEAGAVRGVFCIVNETSERVRSEAALKESEERLRAIFSQSAAGIGQVGLDGRILHANRRFCEILGYGEDEIAGLRLQDITFPEDLPEGLRLFQAMARKGRSYDVEKRFIRKDGGLVWAATSISALRDPAGRIRQAAAIIVDIDERKRAQETEGRLAAIIASSNDAILGADLDMTITSWNAGATKLYGYDAAEAIGRSVMMLVPEDRSGEEPAIIERIREGRTVEPYETQRRCKDGRLLDVLLSVSPIYDAYGKIVGASKIAHDISARKEAERLQGLLVGELNHRVKNVLATVLAIARQTLGREEANREGVEAFVARIASMARAHDLLTHKSWEHAELGAAVAQALSPYPADRFAISGPMVQLPPRAVVAVSLALHELATNAAKYGALSTGAGRITVAWTVEIGEGARLRLSWRETGGPAVAPPARKGFGSRLIEQLLAAELQGEAVIDYRPEGVVCTVVAPLDGGWGRLAAAAGAARAESDPAEPARPL